MGYASEDDNRVILLRKPIFSEKLEMHAATVLVLLGSVLYYGLAILAAIWNWRSLWSMRRARA
jgi:hypothetical protein